MTWLKLSDDFGEECFNASLSDAAFRTHVEGLLWAMRRETGGRIRSRDVPRFADSPDAERGVAELVNAGFWAATADGYVIEHHMQHQPDLEVIERRRQMDAERQRRTRLRRAKIEPPEDALSRRDSRRDNTRDPGRGGSGRDGTGNPRKAVATKGSWKNTAAEGTNEWPPMAMPGSGLPTR